MAPTTIGAGWAGQWRRRARPVRGAPITIAVGSAAGTEAAAVVGADRATKQAAGREEDARTAVATRQLVSRLAGDDVMLVRAA